MTQSEKELLAGLHKTSYGKALKSFLDEHYKAIGDINSCTSWEETLGRRYAIKLLKEMFLFMEEKKTTERGKNQYI